MNRGREACEGCPFDDGKCNACSQPKPVKLPCPYCHKFGCDSPVCAAKYWAEAAKYEEYLAKRDRYK